MLLIQCFCVHVSACVCCQGRGGTDGARGEPGETGAKVNQTHTDTWNKAESHTDL